MFTKCYIERIMSQQQNLRGRDPFSVQPVPKSFYFPSRQKLVDGSQAIKTWQRDEGNKNNNMSSLAATIEFNTLPYVCKVDTSDRKDDTTIQFGEVWPDNERPSSPSFVADTTVTDSMVGETSMNCEETGTTREAYDRLRYQKDKPALSANKNVPSEESTLHKYIERFRKSEPKPREERMKEMTRRKQEFWWLRPEQSSQLTCNQGEEAVKLERNTDLKETSSHGVKLTKEALLAMDEATLHLQTKADRLLSKSELSLMTSSGPIVSTDGLGNSYSLSDQSTLEDVPPYRPAFVQTRDMCKGVEPSKLASREGKHVHQSDHGDILARWRFRRKMEDSESQHQPTSYLEPRQSQASKGSEMDVRLEEFRQRLLSQRMLVTPMDIHYERQKMNMLLEEDEEQEAYPRKVLPSSRQLPSDLVLERLQRITTSHAMSQHDPSPTHTDISVSGAAQSRVQNHNRTPHNEAPELDGNNSSIKSELLSNSLLNTNNTASSNRMDCEDLVCDVDNFSAGVQIVGDAKSRVFNLGQSQQGNSSVYALPSDKQTSALPSDKQTSALPSDKQTSASETEHVENRPPNSRTRLENERSRSHRPLRDLPLNRISNITSLTQENNKLKEDKLSSGKSSSKQRDDVENTSHVYHQFLQAEKPSTDLASHQGPTLTTGSKLNEYPSNVQEVTASESCSNNENSKEKNLRNEPPMQPKASRKISASTKIHAGKTESVCSSDSDAVTEHSRRLSGEPAASSTFQRGSSTQDSRTEEEEGGRDKGKSHPTHQRSKKGETNRTDNSKRTQRKDKSVVVKASASSSRENSSKLTQPVGQPVYSAIGQTVSDHMFDGSLLLSSVDSWASEFPPSPVNAHRSLPVEPSGKTPSPDSQLSQPGRESSPVQHTPLHSSPLTDIRDLSDEEVKSEEEFEDDPLLRLLRQQRSEYIEKLELIEQHLQAFGSIDSGSCD